MKRIPWLVTCLMALCLLSGCGLFGGDDDEKKESTSEKPKAEDTAQPVATDEPTASASPRESASATEVDSPADACDNIAGKQASPPEGLGWLPFSTDGKLYCLSADATRKYNKELEERVSLLLAPLRESFENDGSPQFILQELVDVGCKQEARDFRFWGVASALYGDIVEEASSDQLVREWPDRYSAAIVASCF